MLVATLLIAASEEGPPPLIDVDWTLCIQFALFIIMYFVCAQLLFKPYLRMRDQRRAKTEGSRQEASAMQERAREIVGQYDAQLQRARQRGGEERQRLRSEGAAHEREVVGIARGEAQKALDAARLRISTEAGSARTQLQMQSVSLSRQIVKKILGREIA